MICSCCDDCPFVTETQKEFHEIHVTVRTDDTDEFMKICSENKIKAVIIEDFRGQGLYTTHIMTSQKLQGTEEDAVKELNRIKSVLKDFHILREKIETNLVANRDYLEGYFESHLEFNVINLATFERILARIGGLLLSRNKNKAGNYMATVREFNTNPISFHQKMDYITSRFLDYGYKAEKQITEYCYLDTGLDQDRDWKPVQ